MQQALDAGLLINEVPPDIKAACDRLIASYSGDFLEEFIANHLDEFEPWASSWARKPFTLYQDDYLQALWYAAEYELHQGQRFAGDSDEGTRRRGTGHYE